MESIEEIRRDSGMLENVLYYAITACLALVVFHLWKESTRYVKLGRKLPGIKPLPLVGNAFEVITLKPHELVDFTVKKLESEFKDETVIGVWLGYKLLAALIDPADIEIILGSHVHINKSDQYRYFKPWLGDGLLISSGEKWKTHRKIIAPTFHIHVLKSFIPTLNKNATDLVEKFRKEIGKTFDVHDYMSSITVDVLLETVMGVKKPEEKNASFNYAMAVLKLCEIIHNRHYKYWQQFDSFFSFSSLSQQQKNLINLIHDLRNKVVKFKTKAVQSLELQKPTTEEVDSNISQMKKAPTSPSDFYSFGSAVRDDLDETDIGEKKRRPFLEEMIRMKLNDPNSLRQDEINEEVDTIMFEGHDTTAAATSFVLSVLGIHQDIQDKVVRELNDIFRGSKRPATYEDVVQMKLLERVIMETLRLYPPVPIIARKLTEDVKLASKDYVLPKGTTVVIGTYFVHRRPQAYPNPEVFDPDNFLPERCVGRHHYSFIPFSAGPRSCVGRKYAMLKMKVLLSSILRNYKINSNVAEKDFVLQGDIILKRADGFKIQIEKRV